MTPDLRDAIARIVERHTPFTMSQRDIDRCVTEIMKAVEAAREKEQA